MDSTIADNRSHDLLLLRAFRSSHCWVELKWVQLRERRFTSVEHAE